MRDVVIHVCVTCRRDGDDVDLERAGARLLAALADGGLAVTPVECLGNCKRSCSVALSSTGTWTYVFGDLTAESARDVAAAAALLGASVDGLMPWRGRPDTFKRGMIARIPPLPPLKEAAE
jgi:predicted metal-binding protein